jgi:hypothetical protein
MHDLFSVQGKRVAITGGGRGIGLMLAEAFAHAGATWLGGLGDPPGPGIDSVLDINLKAPLRVIGGLAPALHLAARPGTQQSPPRRHPTWPDRGRRGHRRSSALPRLASGSVRDRHRPYRRRRGGMDVT